MSCEVIVSAPVARELRLQPMLAAIEFDNEARSKADKVQDISIEWDLSAEMKSVVAIFA